MTFSILWSGLLQKRSRFTATIMPCDVAEVPVSEHCAVPESVWSSEELRSLFFNFNNFAMFESALGCQFAESFDLKTSLHPPPPICTAASADIT